MQTLAPVSAGLLPIVRVPGVVGIFTVPHSWMASDPLLLNRRTPSVG